MDQKRPVAAPDPLCILHPFFFKADGDAIPYRLILFFN